jgi:hypothetical protein
MYILIFSVTFIWNIFQPKNNSEWFQKWMYVILLSACYLRSILTTLE